MQSSMAKIVWTEEQLLGRFFDETLARQRRESGKRQKAIDRERGIWIQHALKEPNVILAARKFFGYWKRPQMA